MHEPRSYSYFANIFFFLPSSVSIVWLVTLMVSLGASRLAQAAGHAMVFVLLVVGHCQRAAETFGEFQRLPVFRILFGSLLPPENGHGGFHARQ